MMSDFENICSTLIDRPDNVAMARLCDLLNNNRFLDVDKALLCCGCHLSGTHFEESSRR